ncbi:MAG: SOS response-associated peptidase [Polyangiaceae bacterium]|nr:SOS response-associated peptidase [Polyangiaceae bacterium]MBK8938308.1 SOS response-associated peptidase [Polyangiaceae bacterium]
MCGRFTLTVPTYEELADALGAAAADPLAAAAYRPRYNVAPTDPAWIVRMRDGVRELSSSEWGLIPRWSKAAKQAGRPINARAETLSTRPLFRESFEQRRCAVVSDGFLEWDKTPSGRVPYWFRPREGGLLLMAGLWDRWFDEAAARKVCTFAIVTTDASDDVAPLHDRMPVILTPEALATWLAVPVAGAGGATEEALREIMAPRPHGTLDKTRVSRRVGSVKNDDPQCLLPGDADDTAPRPVRTQAKRGASSAATLPLFELPERAPAKASRR